MIFNQLFASYLSKEQFLKQNVLDEWVVKSNKNQNPIFYELVKNNVCKEEPLFQKLAAFLDLEYRFVQLTEVNLDFVNKFPRDKIIEFQAVPLYENDDGEVIILTSNPFKIEEIQEFHYNVPNRFKIVLTIPSQMRNIVDFINNKNQQNTVLNDFANSELDITDAPGTDITIDAPVIKLVDSILREAVVRKASDIHIEPFEKVVRIRFRIDGKLTLNDNVPIHLFPAILARIKIMAEMNIAERRVPQDGKIGMEINGQSFDFRVSTIPTLHGEKAVIRIYNISFAGSNLSILGFSQKQENMVEQMITRPHGIILLTGPTGSGKSTTLYTMLRYLNDEQTNIITVEDPVENEIPGINQVQVNPKATLTFANALRSILRQDPNVIMIGEIRDEETAQIATRAAITGHLVLSSIHTNDAAGVVTRLINMGIPKYLVADSLLGAISQRLVRKLCPKCRHEHITTLAEMKTLNLKRPAVIYEAGGCPYCNNTGYVGRIGVFEIMLLDEEIRSIIMSDDYTSEHLNAILQKNSTTLLDNTRERVLNGETTVEEFDALCDVVESKRK